MKMRKVGIITIFAIVLLISTVCFATTLEKNEVEDENQTISNSTNDEYSEFVDELKDSSGETEDAVTTEIGSTNTVSKNVYSVNVTDSYTLNDNVRGNVFITGNEVIIDSNYISGDIFIFANNITISEDTVIDGNAYLGGQTINVNGTIYRSAYIAGKIIKFAESSDIEYDVFVLGELVKIAGEMGRSANIYAETLEVQDTALIYENLNYEAEEKAEIADSIVKGEVNFQKIDIEEQTLKEIVFEYVISMLQFLILVLVIFIVIGIISKKFIYKAQESIGKHFLKTIGIGLFGLIIIPMIAIMLLLFGATSLVGVALIPAYILLLMIANPITAISVASFICARREGMKIQIVVPLVAIALWALEEIPYIGIIVSFISILIGIGVLLQSIAGTNKTISQGEKDK